MHRSGLSCRRSTAFGRLLSTKTKTASQSSWKNGVITRYDQGTGELAELQSTGSISQDEGVVSFRLQALQTFIDLNDSRPAEFIITGEGPVQEDGTILIFLRFSMVDGNAEGGLNAVMRRR